jgi:hypothetical protein
MSKAFLITFLLSFSIGFSQTKAEVEKLLTEISKTENSKEIIKTSEAKKLTKFGKKALPILSGQFTNTEVSNVYSDCEKRKLLKGEIAIIVADHIKKMPYFQLTGIQNCILSHCEKNPNLIEYYFQYIGSEKLAKFKKKYDDWLKEL